MSEVKQFKVTDKNGVATTYDILTLQDSKSITITENGTTIVTADEGYDGISKTNITVDVPIPEGYVKPTGNLEITENGDYNVTEKASVSVNVPSTGGEGYQMSLSADGIELNFVWGGAKKEISFTIDGTEYKALEGMTWAEWCESEYNTNGWETISQDNSVRRNSGSYVYFVDNVIKTDIITSMAYTTHNYVSGGGASA